jgi:hypothetical protein
VEIQTRCDIDGAAIPDHLADFVDQYTSTKRQLSLRLA